MQWLKIAKHIKNQKLAGRKELGQFCDQFVMNIPISYPPKSHKIDKIIKIYISKKPYKKLKPKKEYENKTYYPSKEYYKKSFYKKPNKKKR